MKTKVRVVEGEFERDGSWVRQYIEAVPVYVDPSDYFYLDKKRKGMTDEDFKKMRKRAEQELENLNYQADLQAKYEKIKERMLREQLGDNWKNILSGMGDQ